MAQKCLRVIPVSFPLGPVVLYDLEMMLSVFYPGIRPVTSLQYIHAMMGTMQK